MKTEPFITMLLLVGALSAAAQQSTPGSPAAAKSAPATTRAASPAASKYSLITSKDWQNPVNLRDSLSKKIQERLKGDDEESVQRFLKSEYNRLLLANWQLVNAELASEKAYSDYTAELTRQIENKSKKLEEKEKELPELTGTAAESAQYFISKLKNEIAALQDELKQPVKLADVVKRPRASRLMTLIANDLGWLGNIVYSGECIMPGRMLNMLASMQERYPRILPNDRMPRDIATATALEYARFGWTVNRACERAEYFVTNWRRDYLHASFDKLPFWQRRVVCGWKGDHSSGDPESLTWALQNVRLPDDRYSGSCWRCGYVLNNVYGDSIHGSPYFEPFEGLYLQNHHKFTQEVGGVCGGLSHFGASAACANGIPGLTMGEPGHCAYVVWTDGKWVPAYSLTWDRGLHWRPWMDNYNYSSLQLTTDLYSAEQKQATRLSNAFRVLAQMALSKGEHVRAHVLYLKAQSAQPLHYPVYREHANFLKTTMPDNLEAWLALNNSICSNLTPIYAEVAANLLQKSVYENLRKSGVETGRLELAFSQFWQSTREIGPDRWHMYNMLQKQIDEMNAARPNQEQDNKCTLFSNMLKATISKPAYSTYAMETGNSLMQKMDEAGKSRMLTIMSEAIGSSTNTDPAAREKALVNIILAAEATRDVSAFQSVSKLVSPEAAHLNRPIDDFEAFPGTLVSEGGVVYASSTSQWDQPATHANLLTRLGGQIHTAKNPSPWVAVKLPKHATISGVIIAAHPNNANWHRLNNLQIQISETGKDDDWHTVGQTSGTCNERLIRFDLGTEQPKALHVRVIRPEVNEVFHIDGIFVYGTPAA